MKLLSAAALAAFAAAPSFAAGTVTLDFEGASGYVNPILQYYNGGTDAAGHQGPNDGIVFSAAAVALSNDVLGPYYSNAPSPLTVMFAFDSSAVMNVAAGFVDRLTFYYSASDSVLDAVTLYSGLDATGTLLTSVSLFGNATVGCSDTSYCRFDLTSVKFAGIAKSISFAGNAPNVLYDDLTITTVPEPASAVLLAAGLAAAAAAARRRRNG